MSLYARVITHAAAALGNISAREYALMRVCAYTYVQRRDRKGFSIRSFARARGGRSSTSGTLMTLDARLWRMLMEARARRAGEKEEWDAHQRRRGNYRNNASAGLQYSGDVISLLFLFVWERCY